MVKADFARIAPDVKLGRDVKIYAFVNLYGCEIGDESKMGTFVEIQKGAKIGKSGEDFQSYFHLRGRDHRRRSFHWAWSDVH